MIDCTIHGKLHSLLTNNEETVGIQRFCETAEKNTNVVSNNTIDNVSNSRVVTTHNGIRFSECRMRYLFQECIFEPDNFFVDL